MADDDIFLTTSARADRTDEHHSIPKPVYKKTYSWAHNTNDANWAAYITIARAPEHRHSEEDMERGVGNASVSGRPEEQPLLETTVSPAETREHKRLRAKMNLAMWSSLVANVLLLVAKIVAYVLSHSSSILASAADSFVDIASQVVIAVAEKYMRSADPSYPVGRTRLETVGVVACAVIMTIATIEVIQAAAGDLVDGFAKGQLPELQMTVLMYIILGSATGIKILLFIYCYALKTQSDSMLALAEDHRNDIVSNLGAIAFGAIASSSQKVWWFDPAGAILISAYIIWSWACILKGQVDKIVGKGAPTEFIEQLEDMVNTHHEKVAVDVIRAYHFGARFIVEVEVIMPATWSVKESHDVALTLQHKVEGFDEVERAFVHVDYERRDEPEHKVERNLLQNKENLFEAHASLSGSLHGAFSGEGSQDAKESPREQHGKENGAR
ncbi:hypothetical protein CVIRNUC_007978 [Coccomyxa viridis]|uniref:Cation efflux protein cytoplasmic domain-containing protein n=1 Tax=Coccomyxa viridis TaxID=1274662 RepID=A0AAV1IFK9_9CHLO|nr:hypothetical protein CVIRNUC_007978 [Coccomyxa viridis]